MRFHTSVLAASILVTQVVMAQQVPAATPPSAVLASQPTETKFKQEELDQIIAPIALYPDALLSQLLMASTYPLEVVQAQRWTDAHKDLTGDPLAVELEKQTWDPSVKSLVNTPQVLTMMSEKLDWTMKLGDAFLEQQKDVMYTIQKLRAKAQAQGNLKSSNEQQVSLDTSNNTQTIIIQQANPQVIYVPTYDPAVVYGTWWYPTYPPYYYYPPYYRPAPGISFGVGLAVGVAWGYAWGHCDWHHTNIDIDINRNVNINTRIDRNRYSAEFNRTNIDVQNGRSSWQHDSSHRQGAPYRDRSTADRFGQASPSTRQQYRGFDSLDSSSLHRGDNGLGRASDSLGTSRDLDRSSRDLSGARDRVDSSSGRGGALEGVSHGGDRARSDSARGNSSRSGGNGSRSSGGARSGGGSGGGRSGGRGR